MKHFHFGLCLLSLLSTVWGYGQQSDSLAIKVKEKQDVIRHFEEPIYVNPSHYLDYRKYSLTSFEIAKQNSKNETTLAQEGKNRDDLSFQAEAYHKLDKHSAVWGSATYQQGKRRDVMWNESADYDLIFPYVVADSVGGDIKYEDYHIEGGYAQRLGKYNIGISGFYKAKMEYRNIDPRPKNLSARLGGNIGVSRVFEELFTIGVNTSIEKYTQKHKMDFYSPTGFPVIYEMSGMGNFNNLLKGKRREAYYDGWRYGTSLQVYDTSQKKWFATVGMNIFSFEKLLPDFDDLQASKVKDIEHFFSVGKLFDIQATQLGVRLDGNMKTRKGTENLFVNVSATNYLKIGQEEQYKYENKNLRLSGVFKYETLNSVYSILPYIGITQEVERYKKPYSKTDIQYTYIGADLQWMYTFKDRSLLTVASNWKVRQTAKEKATFNYGNSNAINQMLLDNYAVQIAEYWEGSFKVRYDFALPKVIDVFVGGEYYFQNYKQFQNNSSVMMSLGITF
ncbi:DUF6850 family outer membrane beta-barrel protein [Myroides odoratimimus]|uniref:DUF6850 family outer membrane beta-barrel protein n=1 Tax=Myroides odoratimimus TaxID=76832 RepID=UPI0025781602|nr:DUF6850 family outer membrane beta-barrel protein [Myroides odoratimimus]MDM1519975.1 hypothetical protein [Myroides odoratimimus]